MIGYKATGANILKGDKRKMNDLKGIIEDCNKSDLISDKIIKKIIEIIGQEEWQDLHDENNDVCTTMGELIITLKGIAELEKENAELQQKWLNESYEKAKLVEKWKHNGENIIQECKDIEGANAYYEHQLTKAKELLREIVDTPVFNQMGGELYENEGYAELVKEAEQFLNSEVEK